MSEAVKIKSEFGTDLVPVSGTDLSVGYDIKTPVDILMPYGTTMVIDTGLVVDVTNLDQKLFTLIVPRSSAGWKHGLEIENTIGVIDPDYNGPEDTIKVKLRRKQKANSFNKTIPFEEYIDNRLDWDSMKARIHKKGDSKKDWVVHLFDKPSSLSCNVMYSEPLYHKGDRFCQMLFLPYEKPDIQQIKESVNQSRGGIGSTGDKGVDLE